MDADAGHRVPDLADAVASSADGLLTVSQDGVISFANPAASALLGIPELVGTTIGVPVDGDGVSVIDIVLPEGERRVVEFTVTAIDDAETEFVCSLHDITHRAAGRDGRLEDELARRRLRLSAMAHDLGNSVTVISGMARVLESGAADATPQEIELCSSTIARHAEQIRRLAKTLATQMDVEEGRTLRTDAEAVDIRDIVDALGDYYRAIAVEVIVTGPAQMAVWADRSHVEEMLGNLLENARKHGEPPINVDLSSDGADVTIAVTDHGRGIDSVDETTMWDHHARGRTSGTVEGSGLGLYILRELAEANDGSIEYHRADAGGASFVLTLPAVG